MALDRRPALLAMQSPYLHSFPSRHRCHQAILHTCSRSLSPLDYMLLEVRDLIHCCFPALGTGLGTDVALLEFVFNRPLCEATFLSPPQDHGGSELFVIKLYVGDGTGGKGLTISLPSCNLKDLCEDRDGSRLTSLFHWLARNAGHQVRSKKLQKLLFSTAQFFNVQSSVVLIYFTLNPCGATGGGVLTAVLVANQ